MASEHQAAADVRAHAAQANHRNSHKSACCRQAQERKMFCDRHVCYADGNGSGAKVTIDEIMRTAPVIPVLVLEREMDWTELAETFVDAGLPVLEVTLRTPVAMDAIRQMSRVAGAIVGAGTVLNEAQLA